MKAGTMNLTNNSYLEERPGRDIDENDSRDVDERQAELIDRSMQASRRVSAAARDTQDWFELYWAKKRSDYFDDNEVMTQGRL